MNESIRAFRRQRGTEKAHAGAEGAEFERRKNLMTTDPSASARQRLPSCYVTLPIFRLTAKDFSIR
jgi:hypothetical protein